MKPFLFKFLELIKHPAGGGGWSAREVLKLSAMITDDLFWETMKLPDMVKKESGNSN